MDGAARRSPLAAPRPEIASLNRQRDRVPRWNPSEERERERERERRRSSKKSDATFRAFVGISASPLRFYRPRCISKRKSGAIPSVSSLPARFVVHRRWNENYENFVEQLRQLFSFLAIEIAGVESRDRYNAR